MNDSVASNKHENSKAETWYNVSPRNSFIKSLSQNKEILDIEANVNQYRCYGNCWSTWKLFSPEGNVQKLNRKRLECGAEGPLCGSTDGKTIETGTKTN